MIPKVVSKREAARVAARVAAREADNKVARYLRADKKKKES